MSEDERPIPGFERGRRRERIEWGVRWKVDNIVRRHGEIEWRSSEANARECVESGLACWRGTEVVSRTVVTYTSNWAAS